jgi:uncharacterized membrane protein YcaP (DUF421 family)
MDQIVPLDLQRMLLGDTEPLYLVEICVRVGVIWLWTVALLRWVGGRSISQMSVVEFILVIALGSAVGDPMFQPDVPLLHAMLVIFLIVCLDKLIDYAFRQWRWAKRLVDGTPDEVMRDGQILMGGINARKIGATELMEMLRLQGVRNLGEVEHAFLEPSGDISLFKFDEARPGLRIVPPVELRDPPPPDPRAEACCTTCGLVRPKAPPACEACGATQWTVAETRDKPARGKRAAAG